MPDPDVSDPDVPISRGWKLRSAPSGSGNKGRNAQRALGESIPLALLEASPNAIIGVDSKGLIRYANPEIKRLFGHDSQDLIGKPIELLLPERVGDRHEEHRTGFIRRPHARPMGIGMDLAGRRRNGQEFPVEISLSPVMIHDEMHVFATVVDITSRKRAELELAASERRFRAVLDANPNPVVGIDTTGRLIYVNPYIEASFGYKAEEILGQPVEVLLPVSVRERHVAHRTGYVDHPASRPMGIGMDLAARRKDGTEFPAEISLSPVETPGGYEIFARIVDITARKAAENELLQAQKLESIGRLAGGIAHDFNNVLFAMGGYAELLEQDLSTDGPIDRVSSANSAAAIRNAVSRAQDLTSQLLAFSRQQIVQPRVVDLNSAVKGVESMLRRLIGANIRLSLSLAAQEGQIKADPGQLDQILINLAVNARDAMPDGGTLTITTGHAEFDSRDVAQHAELKPGRHVYLAVSDTGVGMDAETRDHIFEPFFTTKERGQGTGLGLATIYGIVGQTGGHIWVYSEPGRGSTFKLYFPHVDEPAVDTVAIEESFEQAAVLGTVLLAEDDPHVREMTAQMLERAGYQVNPAADAAHAIEMFERMGQIDALVTDVIMPGISGIELAEQVLDRRPSMGIVLLSGYTEETLGIDHLRARHVEFVSKPVAGKQLLQAVARAAVRSGSAGT